jgi:hypothetical protein
MKLSAILLSASVVLFSLTVNAQEHPKKDTAGVHHEHKGGKKEFSKDKPAHAGKPGDSTVVKKAKPAHYEGKPHAAKEAPAAAKQ